MYSNRFSHTLVWFVMMTLFFMPRFTSGATSERNEKEKWCWCDAPLGILGFFPQQCSANISMSAVVPQSIFYPKSPNGCWVLVFSNDTRVCTRTSVAGWLVIVAGFSVITWDVRVRFNVLNDTIDIRYRLCRGSSRLMTRAR